MRYRPAQLIEHFVGGVLDIVEPEMSRKMLLYIIKDDSALVDRHRAVFN
jgi:hypothetical protein